MDKAEEFLRRRKRLKMSHEVRSTTEDIGLGVPNDLFGSCDPYRRRILVLLGPRNSSHRADIHDICSMHIASDNDRSDRPRDGSVRRLGHHAPHVRRHGHVRRVRLPLRVRHARTTITFR